MLRPGEPSGNGVELRTGGPGSIPDAAKDPLRKCGILARKVRGSENPVVGRSLAVSQ